MNRLFRSLLCLSILVSQGIMIVPVVAETTPSQTSDSTLASSSTLPTNIDSSTEERFSQTQESTSSSVLDSSVGSSSDSVAKTDTIESQNKEKGNPAQVSDKADPQAINLIEGVDIDAQFAQLLRTDPNVQDLGTSWTGYGKKQDQLTDADMVALTKIDVSAKNLTSLKGIEYALNITTLECSYNQLRSLNLESNKKLSHLYCQNNLLEALNLSDNADLYYVYCGDNQLTSLNVSRSPQLTILYCQNNRLENLDISQNSNLNILECSNNKLASLNVENNLSLALFQCQKNELTSLDVSKNTNLSLFNCSNNLLKILDVSRCSKLENLNCSNNQISDITSLNNLRNLNNFDASNQNIWVPVPNISNNNERIVNILKTTANQGLSVFNTSITPPPILSTNGDQIVLSNVTRQSMVDKAINFHYDDQQLVEGAVGGGKLFSGNINFFDVSDLTSDLKPDQNRVLPGNNTEWTWIVTNLSSKQAQNIYASLNMPTGLTIDQSTIRKNGLPATISDLNGTNNLGSLSTNGKITFTFKTSVVADPGAWLELIGTLNWEDNGSYTVSSSNKVKIIDEEQVDKPVENTDLEVLSVPLSFRYGTWPISSNAQTIHLNSKNYQTHTNVVTKGFYTRIEDERTNHTGWKLTAQLSNFKDDENRIMPNSSGTSLRLENMTIESIINRDTPQETIDPSPAGVPSTVASDETLVAGQAAKNLIHAEANQGVGNWQLRIPFDKVTLTLPANAGEKNKNYTATLTWSLDDTP